MYTLNIDVGVIYFTFVIKKKIIHTKISSKIP